VNTKIKDAHHGAHQNRNWTHVLLRLPDSDYSLSSNPSCETVIVEKANVARACPPKACQDSVNAISRQSHHFERVAVATMTVILLYGIYLSQMTKDMLCFLSLQSESLLINDLLLVCSHSNTTGATSRVEQHLRPVVLL